MIRKKNPTNRPELKKVVKFLGLFSSSNLQVTISVVSISVFQQGHQTTVSS